MRSKTAALALALAAPLVGTSCASLVGNVEGIWLIYVTPSAETTCDEGISHNFTDAYAPDVVTTDSEWTTDESYNVSDQLIFGQIIKSSSGTATLIIDDAAYPGTKVDGKTWSFTWSGSTDTYSNESHSAGYDFMESNNGASDVSWSITFDGDTFSGTVEASSDDSVEYSETDEWDFREVGQQSSQIPSSFYLVRTNQFDEEESATNNSEEQDCDSDPCFMTITTTCSSSQSVRGEWSGYNDEAPYFGLEDAGQPAGGAL